MHWRRPGHRRSLLTPSSDLVRCRTGGRRRRRGPARCTRARSGGRPRRRRRCPRPGGPLRAPGSLRRRDQPDVGQRPAAAPAQHVHRRDGRAARRQHRIEQDPGVDLVAARRLSGARAGCSTRPASASPRRGTGPRCQTSALGTRVRNASTIPRPARRIGTSPTDDGKLVARRIGERRADGASARAAGSAAPRSRAASRSHAPARGSGAGESGHPEARRPSDGRAGARTRTAWRVRLLKDVRVQDTEDLGPRATRCARDYRTCVAIVSGASRGEPRPIRASAPASSEGAGGCRLTSVARNGRRSTADATHDDAR